MLSKSCVSHVSFCCCCCRRGCVNNCKMFIEENWGPKRVRTKWRVEWIKWKWWDIIYQQPLQQISSHVIFRYRLPLVWANSIIFNQINVSLYYPITWATYMYLYGWKNVLIGLTLSLSLSLSFTWSVIQRSSFRINANSYSDEPKHVCGYWWFIRVSAIVPMLSSASPLLKANEKRTRSRKKNKNNSQ